MTIIIVTNVRRVPLTPAAALKIIFCVVKTINNKTIINISLHYILVYDLGGKVTMQLATI
jgi:hypothetical protein